MGLMAVSDVHFPVFRELFKSALEKLKTSPEIFLFAGDIASKGRQEYYAKAVEIVKEKFPSVKIYACFGNEEYDQEHDNLKKITHIRFLEEEMVLERVNSEKIAIIGTRGIIDKPTPWQRKNIPEIEKVYEDRLRKVGEMLKKARQKAGVVLLLTHYAPTYVTLKGEKKQAYPFLGSKKMERLIKTLSPEIVVHGHAHHGTRFAVFERIRIYNVALPLNRKIVTIDIHTGLEKFW